MQEGPMYPSDDLLPSLEEGVYPLSRLFRPTPLKSDSPYPFLRVLLSLSLEKESVDAALALSPVLPDQDARRDASLIARTEARQAIFLSGWLSSRNEPENLALFYALLTLELSASLAQRMGEGSVRKVLDFFIPEYLDELYRVANLMALHGAESAQSLLNGYAEIMPGRPLIACHRHPYDCVSLPVSSPSVWESLALLMLSAVEKEKFQLYLRLSSAANDELSSSFFGELSLLSQQHRASLCSLFPAQAPLDVLLLCQYAECYLYDSCAQLCPNRDLAAYASEERDHELSHLRKISALRNRSQQDNKPLPAFPPPLSLGPNKGYVRDTLQNIGVTARREGFIPVGSLPRGADFFRWQKRLCPDPAAAPSHQVIQSVIDKNGSDYRFEIAPHPVEALRKRTRDHTELGR